MFLEGKEPKNMQVFSELFENANDLEEIQDIIYRKYFEQIKQAIINYPFSRGKKRKEISVKFIYIELYF